MSLKPITLYGHVGGPNPYKVKFILEELGIPYEDKPLSNTKEEWFVKQFNPNGRVPAIVDPNNDDFILWESGAIIEYLVDTYDKEGKLKADNPKDNYLLKQYLHFQTSGQGPYFGQMVWFHKFHPEQVESAKTRYEEQVVRVWEVLNNILEGKQYLVGDKLTYADLAFIPWNVLPLSIERGWGKLYREKYDVENKYPNVIAWHKRVGSRPSVKAAYKGTPYEAEFQ